MPYRYAHFKNNVCIAMTTKADDLGLSCDGVHAFEVGSKYADACLESLTSGKPVVIPPPEPEKSPQPWYDQWMTNVRGFFDKTASLIEEYSATNFSSDLMSVYGTIRESISKQMKSATELFASIQNESKSRKLHVTLHMLHFQIEYLEKLLDCVESSVLEANDVPESKTKSLVVQFPEHTSDLRNWVKQARMMAEVLEKEVSVVKEAVGNVLTAEHLA